MNYSWNKWKWEKKTRMGISKKSFEPLYLVSPQILSLLVILECYAYNHLWAIILILWFLFCFKQCSVQTLTFFTHLSNILSCCLISSSLSPRCGVPENAYPKTHLQPRLITVNWNTDTSWVRHNMIFHTVTMACLITKQSTPSLPRRH